jgi:tetratricopeptide (TPR) repeat protein
MVKELMSASNAPTLNPVPGSGVKRRARRLALGALAAASALATGQEEAGRVVVRGTVTDLDGAPLAAEVVLARPEEAEVKVATDALGAWSAVLPAPGRWDIALRATGYYPGAGWIAATDAPGAPPVEVRLRSLEEVPPLAFEGGLADLRSTVERANLLLEAGRPAAAREVYETALPHLDGAARAEALRAVARTWYLEGDLDRAAAALEGSLAAAPGAVATRQLYLALAEQRGRRAEAEALLAALDREGPAALPVPPAEPPAPREPARAAQLPQELATLPAEPPVPGRRGWYRTTFAERSPLSGIDEQRRRFAIPEAELAADPDGGALDLAGESFHVWVPETYQAAEGWGLLVWISPTDFGGFVRTEIAEALAAHRLVWVGADEAGNARARWDRAGLALDAAAAMPGLYDLDARRIFVAGYSGGGRVASGLALAYPEVFSGVLALFGADYFRHLPVPDRPGFYWPPRVLPPSAPRLARLEADRAFVLLTGELDFNRAEIQQVHRAMRADGFRHATLLEIPGASHTTSVPADWLERALAALEVR